MRKKSLIISAFPGCGKTSFYNKYSIYSDQQDPAYKEDGNCRILDSDSSKFSWIWKDGVKTDERNPEFPQNYIQHIKDNIFSQNIIFISTHKSVRDLLAEDEIEFYVCYPKKELKDEFIRRYTERGSSDEFIKQIQDNWDSWIDQMAKMDIGHSLIIKDANDTIETLISKYKLWSPKNTMI